MRIITGHYHLNPGGVTKIIQSQLNGLFANDTDVEVSLVYDGQGAENISTNNTVNFNACSDLGYLPQGLSVDELKQKYKSIKDFLYSQCKKDDIIHFHNIGLGKNPLVSIVFYEMAKEGYRILNHAHDFAEDRPVNLAFIKEVFQNMGFDYYEDVLYPQLDNYLFGVLNSFDYNRLVGFNIPKERIQLWPNPVNAPKTSELHDKEQAKAAIRNVVGIENELPYVVYPVRAITRKNIGEFILFAKLLKTKANFFITLPPLNPVEIVQYQAWKTFCEEENISLHFDVGTKASFLDVMAATDICFTTSIMEGFGMVFVEPWLWGNPVAGREISAVIPDIKNIGVDFPLLYSKILLPECDSDFGSLSMNTQMEIIKKSDNSYYDAFLTQNPSFKGWLDKDWSVLIDTNAAVIKDKLSELEYGKKLLRTYKTLL